MEESFKRLIDGAGSEQKKRYQMLCKEARQEEVDRGKITKKLKTLLEEMTREQGRKVESGWIGIFWKRFSPKEEKKQEKRILSLKELRELSFEMPYPLGFRTEEFVRETEEYLEERGSTNYAFLLASMNGLLLRFFSALALSVYIRELNAPDVQFNQEIVESLEAPADGTWKHFLDRILQEGLRKQHPWLLRLHEEITSPRWTQKAEKKESLRAAIAMQEMIQFRNQLLHSSHRFQKEEILLAILRIQTILSSLSAWKNLRIDWLRKDGERIRCFGREIKSVSLSDIEKKEERGGEDTREDREIWCEGEEKLILYERLEDGKVLSCSVFPFLVFFEREKSKDILFFNSLFRDKIDYLSYRWVRQIDPQELAFASKTIYEFFRRLPAVRLHARARIDFYEVSRVHLQAFVGRKELIRSLYRFIEQPPKPWGVVYSQSGQGKTALFAKLYHDFQKRHRDWPKDLIVGWHFFGTTEERDQPILVLRSLLAQMDRQFSGNEEEYPTSFDLLCRLFQKKQEEILAGGKRFLMILEGIDDAIHIERSESLFSFILPPSQIPKGIAVLCSYRVDMEKRSHPKLEQFFLNEEEALFPIEGCTPLQGLDKEEMKALLAKASKEILRYPQTIETIWKVATTERLLEKIGLSGSSREEEFAKRGRGESPPLRFLSQREGVFAEPLILRFFYDELIEGKIDPKRKESVPQSLWMIFDRLWDNLSTGEHYFLHRFLGLLAHLPSTGDDLLLSKILSKSRREDPLFTPEEIAQKRRPINRLLAFHKDQYYLFHRSFRDYIQQRFHDRDLIEAIYLPLYRYCISPEESMRAYDLRHRIYFLHKIASLPHPTYQERAKESLFFMCLDDDFFSKKYSTFESLEMLEEDILRILFHHKAKRDSSFHRALLSLGKIFLLTEQGHRQINAAQREFRIQGLKRIFSFQKDRKKQGDLKKEDLHQDLALFLEQERYPTHRAWLFRLLSDSLYKEKE